MKNLIGNSRTPVASVAGALGFAGLILLALLLATRATLAQGRIVFAGLHLIDGASQIEPTELVGPPSPPSDPIITQIVAVGNEIIVSVWVPAGKQRVTLECRPRLGPGSWVPESRQNLDGREREVEFRLSNRRELELLRVRAESENDLPLPSIFYSGRSQFGGVLLTNMSPLRSVGVGPIPGSFVGSTATSMDSTSGGLLTTEVRTVAESDIWRLDGNTLYFFNQGRGLQVIDVSIPDQPQLKGALPVATYGEQMHLLPAVGAAGEHYVALLLASGCSEGGTVLIAQVAPNGAVTVVNQLPFAGQLRESRLVGNALYLASYWWHSEPVTEPDNNGEVNTRIGPWQSDTVVTSYNLSNPAASDLTPATLSLPANPNAISATDRFLFVATTANSVYDPVLGTTLPGINTVEIIDISDPAGALVRRGSVVTRGAVADKFKLSQHGDVLRVASFRNSYGIPRPITNWFSIVSGQLVATTGGKPGVSNNPPPGNPDLYRTETYVQWEWPPTQTWLETYSLVDASAPVKLGELLLKENEQLYATRFAGDRAYLVTFRQIDPLFLVDLSNPALPAIRGLLEVPGFSTYLSPLSDSRLLAMGLENGQPIVSLFDVGDVTRPRLISKVDLKSQNGWGYSEANNDEKAFNYSPEAGLILFPWQGWQDGRSFQTIQLVDLKDDVLTRRGVIDHAVTARRATVLGDRVLSLSAAELLSVSIADRDHPAVTATLPLQYRVDRIWVLGERLLQLRFESSANGSTTKPWLLLAQQSAPEQPTGLLSLPEGLSTLGLDLRGSQLHVLQQSPTTYRTDPQIFTNTVQEWVTHKEARRETNTSITILPSEFVLIKTTNVLVTTVSQPPLKPIIGTNEQVVVVQYPLFPTLVPYQTNITCASDLVTCETNVFTNVVWVELPPLIRTNRTYVYGPEIPQPDLVVTNEIVSSRFEESPGSIITNAVTIVTNWYSLKPVLETNQYVVTNYVSVPVPGYLLASVVDCTGVAPRLVGQVRSDAQVLFSSGTLAAVWPADTLLVWTDAIGTDNNYRGPWAYGPQFGGFAIDIAVGPAVRSDWWGGGWWGGWWGGQSLAHFLPVEVADPALPVIKSPSTVGESQSWSAVHKAHAANGRIFFGHETRTQLPDLIVTNDPGTKPGGGGDIVIGGPGFSVYYWPQRWETHYHLDVLDLTDPVEARLRTPLPLPGQLTGISHGGALLYTRGGADSTGAWIDQLQALSYDGLVVNLVDSLPLNVSSLLLRSDGVALIGIPDTTNSPPALESWALGTDARWHRYAQIPLNDGPALSLHSYADGLVIAERPNGIFSFLKSVGPDSLTLVGNASGHCGLYPDWSSGDASITAGLWLARGPHGLWVIRPTSVPLNP